MAIELTAYAAPLPGGVALVAPANAPAAVGPAGSVLAARPQAARLTLLTPTGETPIDWSADVRSFFRRAAARAVLPRVDDVPGPRGRWHAALVACGWLFIVGGAGGASAGLAGLWLAVVYPLLRRTVIRREAESFALPAAQLASTLDAAPLVTREHAGLSALARVVESGAGTEAERYRQAAATCAPVGLAPLADFYEALARGAQPPMPWGALTQSDVQPRVPDAEPVEGAKEATDGSVRQPA